MSWEFSDLWRAIDSEIDDKFDDPSIIKLHPHGFIQVELEGRGRRLHVWDDDIPRTADINTLHDHVWDFKSTVLCGCLINYEYEADWNGENKSFELWQCSEDRYDGERGGKVLLPTGEFCDVVNTNIDFIKAGESYSFPAFEFHDSHSAGLTATVFEKTRTFDNMLPRVLCLNGKKPDDVLPVTVTTDWLWNKVASVFE